ncbi:MAG TPA: DUF72 domain-containing protein [Kofleriaceae bacterium]|nr:DUF72 domain-containing protein [Kofleriaceae bacterium]
MNEARIGTVDIPDRADRRHYFAQLSYLELSALFAGPLKPAALARWAEVAPRGTLGLVAPWVFSHRRPPESARLWRHDPTAGDFRDSAPARDALRPFRAAIDAVGAAHAVFRSPPLFAPSAANRDRLRAFFGEFATAEAIGASRVWIPDGLWEPRAAVAFATELGVLCAIDPLVQEPGQPPDLYEDLDAPALYLRVSGLGRAGKLRDEQLEDLLALVEHYEDRSVTIAFESPSRWHDALNLKKLLQAASPEREHLGSASGSAEEPADEDALDSENGDEDLEDENPIGEDEPAEPDEPADQGDLEDEDSEGEDDDET